MNNDIEEEFLKSLNSIELIALEIAKRKLESSFDLKKSIGYLEFLKKINDENEKIHPSKK
tara:strand:+ start:4156 stop:4335 length:180 start_codon:yes stop_codon:yes gene_type:complete